ncbi:MAG: glycosyltransferase family 39 protein [Bellilinea sp.]
MSTTYAAYPLYITYAARLVVAVIGSIMPVIAWKIGKQGKIDYSIPAAIFVGFFPSFVVHSHYSTPDVTISLFTLIIILFAIKYVNSGNRNCLIIATFISALNTTEKYPGLISFGIIILAIIYHELESREGSFFTNFQLIIRNSFKYTLLFIFFLYLIAPTLFIEYQRTYDAILNEARPNHLGADSLGWAGNLIFYAREYLKAGNWLLVLLAIPGAVNAIKNSDSTLIFSAYGYIYWALLSVLSLHWERWALPMYTAPLLFAAYGAASINHRIKNPSQVWAATKHIVIGLAGLGLFLSSLSYSINMTYRDTRYASLLFCEQNGITPQNSLFEYYSPFSPTLESAHDFHEQYAAGVQKEYIILSSSMYGRFMYEPERYAFQVGNYQEIRHEHELIAEFAAFSPGKLSISQQLDALIYYFRRYFDDGTPIRLTGPTIQIYATNWQKN